MRMIRLPKRLQEVLVGVLIAAVSSFLSKILEPTIAWITFKLLKVLIKITKSDNLKDLYGKLYAEYYK